MLCLQNSMVKLLHALLRTLLFWWVQYLWPCIFFNTDILKTHFALTNASRWGENWLDFSYPALYNFIVDFLEPTDDSIRKAHDARDTLAWWNKFVSSIPLKTCKLMYPLGMSFQMVPAAIVTFKFLPMPNLRKWLPTLSTWKWLSILFNYSPTVTR